MQDLTITAFETRSNVRYNYIKALFTKYTILTLQTKLCVSQLTFFERIRGMQHQMRRENMHT
jgi:hypothetical protein